MGNKVHNSLVNIFKYIGIDQAILLTSSSSIISITGSLFSAFLVLKKLTIDEQGFKQSTYFVGIPELLNELKKNGQNLYIATNKRLIPTYKIINYLEWKNYFNEIYTLDTFNPNLKSKTGLISKILELNNFDIADTIYVGDRNEDANAAQFNNLEFMMAKWGYEKLKK